MSEVLNLDRLIGWLETMPPEQEYVWADSEYCVYALFGKAHGADYGTAMWALLEEVGLDFGRISILQPHTFGGALRRARAIKESLSA